MTQTLPILESSSPKRKPALLLDPRAYSRALDCVHCGLCLPACPTYLQTGHEADSPRGRIQLMRGLAEGTIDLTVSVKKHLDLCLDCRGCETACPSGVVYHELIEETRHQLERRNAVPAEGPLLRWLFFHVFTHRHRLAWMLLPARILQKIGLLRGPQSPLLKLLPPRLRKMASMLPRRGPLWPRALPAHTHAGGTDAMIASLHDDAARQAHKMTARVGFFAGCVGGVMFSDVNRKAVELLAACGAEVMVPPGQVCCGAIHHHNGATGPAREMARTNMDAFFPAKDKGVDHVATCIAGCGAMLREYDVFLRDDPALAPRAEQFAQRVRDISEMLAALPLPAMRYPVKVMVAYHDACHLVHAQKVGAAPRELLARIPGLKLVPLAESDLCCGAAGTYNLTQPEMASSLAARKLANVTASGARLCVAGNVGCAMHLQAEADARGLPIRVVHPVELLHAAVFGSKLDG